MAVQSLAGQIFFYNVLGSDTGVIGTRHPQDVVAAQSPVAAQNILQSIIQSVTHMEHTGNIRRRYHNGIACFFTFLLGRKQPLTFPEIIPAFFNVVGLITFVK